jgi:hypothetical protein
MTTAARSISFRDKRLMAIGTCVLSCIVKRLPAGLIAPCLSRGSAGPEILLQNGHDPVIMPFTADQRRLPLDPFKPEAASFITPDCTDVEGKDPQIDPMQAQGTKSLLQHQVYRFASYTPAKMAFVEQPDGQSCAAVGLI